MNHLEYYARYGYSNRPDNPRLPAHIGPSSCITCRRELSRAMLLDPAVHLKPPLWCRWCARPTSDEARDIEACAGRKLASAMINDLAILPDVRPEFRGRRCTACRTPGHQRQTCPTHRQPVSA